VLTVIVFPVTGLGMTDQSPISENKPPFTGPAYWAVALFLIFVWGSAFNMIDVALRYITPLWLVSYRLIIAAVLLVGFVLFNGKRFPPLKDRRWIWYTVLGLTGMSIPFYLTATGQEKIDSGISAILVGVMPLLTIVLAHFFTTEKLTVKKFFGFSIGLIGTIILFLPENFSLALIQDWMSQLLILGAAFFYAVTTILAKRAPKTDAAIGAAMMAVCAAIAGTVMAGLSDPLPVAIPPLGWAMIVGLAVGSTGIATIVYLAFIDRNGPTELAKINYFPPFVSVLIGVFVLGENFSLRIALAFGTIMLGVWIARSRPNPSVS